MRPVPIPLPHAPPAARFAVAAGRGVQVQGTTRPPRCCCSCPHSLCWTSRLPPVTCSHLDFCGGGRCCRTWPVSACGWHGRSARSDGVAHGRAACRSQIGGLALVRPFCSSRTSAPADARLAEHRRRVAVLRGGDATSVRFGSGQLQAAAARRSVPCGLKQLGLSEPLDEAMDALSQWLRTVSAVTSGAAARGVHLSARIAITRELQMSRCRGLSSVHSHRYPLCILSTARSCSCSRPLILTRMPPLFARC